MKTMKRFFALLVFVLMLCGLFAPAYAESDLHFEDSIGNNNLTVLFDGAAIGEPGVFDPTDESYTYYEGYYTTFDDGSEAYWRITEGRVSVGTVLTFRCYGTEQNQSVSVDYLHSNEDYYFAYEMTYGTGDSWRVDSNVVEQGLSDTPLLSAEKNSDNDFTCSIRVEDIGADRMLIIISNNYPNRYTYWLMLDIDRTQQTPVIGPQAVTQTAAPDAGEDEGVNVRPDIVETPRPSSSGGTTSSRDDGTSTAAAIAVSLGGALAGAGAIGAASGGKKNGDEEEKKRKTYRMKVYKGFGDGIRKGARPVTVWARIVEIIQGEEINCPELSAKITVSGTGMNVRPAGMQNTYMGAEVSVPADSQAQTATLTFTFTGAGGVFRNNITFKVLGEPEIFYPELSGDGRSWLERDTGGTYLLMGDRRTYEVLFAFRDAPADPTRLDVICRDERLAAVSWEKVPQYGYTYKAVIQNRSDEPEPDIFAMPRHTIVDIRAEFGKDLVVEGGINLAFYPKGLSVQTRAPTENGRIVIDAFVDEVRYGNDTALTPRFIYTDVYFVLALRTEKGVELLRPRDNDLVFGKLKGTGDVNRNIAAKYNLTVGPTPNAGLYQLQQQDILYEVGGPFLVELPIRAQVNGQTYDAELPLRLKGKAPEPMQDWEIERAKLLFRLRKFVDDDAKRAEWVFLIKEKMSDGHVSAATFRMMSKAIVQEYMDYWREQGEGYKFTADVFDFLISTAECTKWACSVCFSYAMEAYAGPVASAVLQPVFDLMLDSTQELTAAFVEGRPFNAEKMEVYKHLSDAGDNVASNMLASSLKMGDPLAWKKNAQYISMYLAYSFLRNLAKKAAETGEVDIPGVMFDTFKDLTVTMFKIIAGHLFQAWLKNREFQKQAGKVVSENIRKGAALYFARNGGAAVDISQGLKAPVVPKVLLQKFISEEVGADVAHLVDWGAHKADTVSLDLRNNGDLVCTFALWEAKGQDTVWCEINLTACVSDFIRMNAAPLAFSPFDILYDLLFGGVPAARAPVAFPKDPPVVTRHNERLERGEHTKMNEEYWQGKK